MKKLTKTILFAAMLLFALCLVPAKPSQAATVKINKSKITLSKGDTL